MIQDIDHWKQTIESLVARKELPQVTLYTDYRNFIFFHSKRY